MDVLSIASTVYSLCMAIQTWIDQLAEKEFLIHQINSSIAQIRNILHPFTLPPSYEEVSDGQAGLGKGELQLSESIRSVGDVLQRTRDHLIVYQGYRPSPTGEVKGSVQGKENNGRSGRVTGPVKSRKLQFLAFLKPGHVIDKLKDDQKQLNNQLLILLTSLAVIGYFKSKEATVQGLEQSIDIKEIGVSYQRYKIVQTTLSSSLSPSSASSRLVQEIQTSKGTPPKPSDDIADEEAREFWKDYIGAQIAFVANDLFITRLEQWYGRYLGRKVIGTIVMRLDEYGSGGVSPYSLTRTLEVERVHLRSFVRRHLSAPDRAAVVKEKNMTSQTPKSPKPLPTRSQLDHKISLWTPLLVCIDDQADNISHEVTHAKGLGVCVVELSSTALAKEWIEANSDFLYANDHPSLIRYISDNVRLEKELLPISTNRTFSGDSSPPETTEFLNHTAGHNLLQFLRGRLFTAPVLIYCGSSIDTTKYVEQYDMAGSTFNSQVCLDYITALAAGKEDDYGDWRGWKKAPTYI